MGTFLVDEAWPGSFEVEERDGVVEVVEVWLLHV